MIKQGSLILLILGTLLFSLGYGQELDLKDFQQQSDSIVVGHLGPDSRYREDQFYVSFTFNLLSNFPNEVSQSGFSGGAHLGFIRDFPINENRNVALGAGIGLSINTFRSNLLMSKDENDQPIFQILDRELFDYKVNRFTTYLVEAPLQIRWRNSTAESYKFWRIYGGVKIGYLYYFHTKFKQPGKSIYLNDIDGLQRLRYGATFTFGYNTFNFTIYYGLNSLFKNQTTLDGKPVELDIIKIGLEFYIL